MSVSRLAFAEGAWTAAAPGARFITFERHGKRLRLLELSREFVEADWCRKGHWGIVLAGTVELDFAGRIERLQQGDGSRFRRARPESTKRGHCPIAPLYFWWRTASRSLA